MNIRVEQAGIPWLRRGWSSPAPKPVELVPYAIPVRPGTIGRFVLPLDLTAAEGERLCGIIRAIAFPANGA